jgi:hypothetical protein
MKKDIKNIVKNLLKIEMDLACLIPLFVLLDSFSTYLGIFKWKIASETNSRLLQLWSKYGFFNVELIKFLFFSIFAILLIISIWLIYWRYFIKKKKFSKFKSYFLFFISFIILFFLLLEVSLLIFVIINNILVLLEGIFV